MDSTSKLSVRFSKKSNNLTSARSSVISKSKNQKSKKASEVSRVASIGTMETRMSQKNEVSFQELVDIFNDPLYNKDGSRNTKIPFDLYVLRKNREEKERTRKPVSISTITKTDKTLFQEALRKLKRERARSNARRTVYLKNLEKSRVVQKITSKEETRKRIEEKYPCPLKCQVKSSRKKSRSRSRSKNRSKSRNDEVKIRSKRPVIKIPPIKTKPWKSPEELKKNAEKAPRFPKIQIPPFKTRKWVPETQIQPKPKVVINYPPLKLRKRPWTPKEKAQRKKPFQVSKLFYPAPFSTLGKTWHSFKFISPRYQILCGNLSQYSKKFSFVSNGKQSAFISAVALSTFNLYPMKLWKCSLLNEIISYGDVNCRRRLKQLKHKSVIKPSDVYHKIYLKYAKILIEIGEATLKGIYDPENTTEINKNIMEILDKFCALIFLYNGQSYAIWKEDKAFYIFNAEDTDEKGNLVEKSRGGCCVLRSTNFGAIIEYLIRMIRVPKHLYEIFSFRINQKIMLHDLELQQHGNLKTGQCFVEESEVAVEKDTSEYKQPADIEEPKPQTGLAAVLFRHQMEPTFGDNFQCSNLTNHAYITCATYLSRFDKNRAPYISSISLVMLQVCKSSLWMSATIEKIFKIGHEIYVENVEKVLLKREQDEIEWLKAMEPEEIEPEEILENLEEEEEEEEEEETEPQPLTKEEIRNLRRERLMKPVIEIKALGDIPITEIKPVVTIGKMKFELFVETLNIGKISSRKPEELSLKSGIINLFKHYDYGLIIGPDVVAIWREKYRYFLFDPNQCKAYKRFTDDDEEPFNSCLSCFQNLNDLIQLYVENLPKTHRNAVYKICKIDTRDFAEKSLNWHNFKGIGHNKWILCANISESSNEFNEANRNHQSTCTAIVALAKTREMGIFSWTPEDIDEIVRIGDDFYTYCVQKLKETDQFENPNLTLNEIGNELKLEKIIVDLVYEEAIVYGKLHGNAGSLISLTDGLRLFFKNDDLGIVTSCNISVAVLKYLDAFFLFDSHSRDELGRNFNTVDPISSCTVNGAACIIRFTNIEDLSNHLIANLESTESSLYSISKVEVLARLSEAPCLYNYKQFGEESYGAILKAFNDNHEDSLQFKCDAEQKTMCNLLSSFCYANIFNPRFWASNDINEILKIGWKFLCKFSNYSGDFWEHLKNVDVCSIKLSIEPGDELKGIFVVKERILSINNEDEVLEEKIQISEINVSVEGEDSSKEAINIQDYPREQQSSMIQNVRYSEDQTTLEGVLNVFDKNGMLHAILSSSLFTVAIFKMDKFYYLFDPKASMNGMMVRKRLEDFMKNNLAKEYDILLDRLRELNNGSRLSMEEKLGELIFGRQVVFGALTAKPSQHALIFSTSYGPVENDGPISISEKGSAYVAWFTSKELLHQHILNKIPDKFKNESFTLQMISISKEPTVDNLDSGSWNNFERINDNHYILRGTFSQNDTQFPVTHRNNQDVANCILALTFKHLCQDEDWNSTALDVILQFGDRLFRKSLSKKLSITSLDPKDLKLKFVDMDLPIFIRPFVVNCSEDIFCKDFIIKSDDNFPLENMKEKVKTFFDGENNTGLLASKGYYVAIWRCNDALFFFDPHDIGPDGKKKSAGLSSLQRFTSHSDLVEIFWNNVKDIDGFNEFQLVRVNIELNHFKDGEEDVFENMEMPLDAVCQVKTICTKNVQPSAANVEMTICYAVAAHCLCQALESEYYTSDIVDRIIIFGNELVCECCTNDEVCFKDFNLAKHSSCPDEINWNFQLNDTFTTVQMDIFKRGVISKQPCPLPNLIFVLEEFFDFYCSGVLVTNEFIISIWKDNDEYFIFYSCPIDKNGLKTNYQGHAGLTIFKSVHELFKNILKNVKSQNAPFELRICNIKMNNDVKECPKKFCLKNKDKKSWKHEIIMPAVSFKEPAAKNASRESILPNKELRSIIGNLKKTCESEKGYKKFSRGGFIYGNLSSNPKSINEMSRKFHSPAICLYAATMHMVLSMNCWNSDVIDCVILSGNSLYVESSIITGTSEVDITSIVTPMLINNHELKAKAESCLEIAHEDFNSDFLKPIFCELLSCFNACYVTRMWDCWTIAKSDKFYFLFDPLGVEIPGKKNTRFCAVLYRFDSLNQLLEQLKECCETISDSPEAYKLGGILTSIRSAVKSCRRTPTTKKKMKVPKCPKASSVKQFPIMHLRPLPMQQKTCCNDIKIC